MMMLHLNHWMSQHTEVVRLSDRICVEQEFVPELDLADYLLTHRLRYFAYRQMGNHDRAARVEKSLQATRK